jgi:hypothetical protein
MPDTTERRSSLRSLRWSAFVSWLIVAGLAIGGFAAFSPRPAPPPVSTTPTSSHVGDDAGRVAAVAFVSASIELGSGNRGSTTTRPIDPSADGTFPSTSAVSLVGGRNGSITWQSGSQCEASWYGPGFEGRTTANGERYDTDGLTAALHDVAFNTLVTVTRIDTGASVVVRINDRGPYEWYDEWYRHPTRCIDLSRAAMIALGGIEEGVVPVTIEY